MEGKINPELLPFLFGKNPKGINNGVGTDSMVRKAGPVTILLLLMTFSLREAMEKCGIPSHTDLGTPVTVWIPNYFRKANDCLWNGQLALAQRFCSVSSVRSC